MKIESPKDFWAGLMFFAFGSFFLIAARHYRMGSTTSMGPGYFPTMLGGLMGVLGAIIFLRSFAVKGGKVPPMFFRPLFFIILSLLGFAYLLKPIGMVLTLVVLIGVSAFAGHQFKSKEVLVLSIALIVFSVLVFVKGLGLPFQLWPKFLG
jgi:hypothetical protein